MSWIWTIVIGFFAGLVAKFVTPGREPKGFLFTTLLGIAGALVARWLGSALGIYHEGQSAGFIASIIGAVILLLIYQLILRAKAH
jgi:uncharacterized membrane protein YeaQ/YmgE (transglycosylase-associated protein family)